MTKRPLIGLTGRRKKGGQIVNNLATMADVDFDMYYADYTRAVLAAGGIPIHLPIDVDPADVVDRLDGVLLSGGADIDPSRYGREPDGSDPSEAERDQYELSLLDRVHERELPTLGICRGLQMVNVHAGGTLHQHVPVHAGHDLAPNTILHEIAVEAESTLGGLYGERRSVNSLHHQTIDDLGANLRVTARSDDGGVEAIEHTTLPVIAVQWHPELMDSAAQDPIFNWLVDTAAAR